MRDAHCTNMAGSYRCQIHAVNRLKRFQRSWLNVYEFFIYRGTYKSLARSPSRCIFFDDENISFDAGLVTYINSNNIPPIMIINRIQETQNLLSLQLVSFLVGLRNYQHTFTSVQRWRWDRCNFVMVTIKVNFPLNQEYSYGLYFC